MARTAWIIAPFAVLAAASAVYYVATAPPPKPTPTVAPAVPPKPPEVIKAPPPAPATTAKPKAEPKPEQPAPEVRTPVEVIKPVDLWKAFDGNELFAEKKYKGKYVRLQDFTNVIQKDERGRWYAGFRFVTGDYPPNVIAYIDPAHREAFAGGARDVVAKVVGRVNDPAVFRGYVVHLELARVEPTPVP